jgi:DtxR family Mn-dependent transcriptional regulator
MSINSSELSASLQDYLEAVYMLSRAAGFARARDISLSLKVSMPSVNSAVKNLAARGLMTHERYGCIRLTPRGETAGSRIAGHHFFLKDFFTTVLCLPETDAERNACKAEHALSPAALQKLRSLSGFLRSKTRPGLLSSIRSALAGRAPHDF